MDAKACLTPWGSSQERVSATVPQLPADFRGANGQYPGNSKNLWALFTVLGSPRSGRGGTEFPSVGVATHSLECLPIASGYLRGRSKLSWVWLWLWFF
jgi:hypothetical protein